MMSLYDSREKSQFEYTSYSIWKTDSDDKIFIRMKHIKIIQIDMLDKGFLVL